MGLYYNRTSGPLPVSLPGGRSLSVRPNSWVEIAEADEGFSGVIYHLRKKHLVKNTVDVVAVPGSQTPVSVEGPKPVAAPQLTPAKPEEPTPVEAPKVLAVEALTPRANEGSVSKEEHPASPEPDRPAKFSQSGDSPRRRRTS